MPSPITVAQITLAGLPLRFDRDGRYLKRYEPFFTSGPATARFEIRWTRGPLKGPASPDLRPWGAGLRLRRGDMEAAWHWGRKAGILTVSPNRYSFESFLRIYYSSLLPRRRGLLIHAAAVVRNGKGYLFPGVSGSGKTTVARLSGRYTVLTDEIAAVRRIGRRYYLYGTPFFGEMRGRGKNLRAPLSKILFLLKAATPAVMPVRPLDAVAGLLKCVMFFEKGPPAHRKVLNGVRHLASAVPCGRLAFPRQGGFWPLL